AIRTGPTRSAEALPASDPPEARSVPPPRRRPWARAARSASRKLPARPAAGRSARPPRRPLSARARPDTFPAMTTIVDLPDVPLGEPWTLDQLGAVAAGKAKLAFGD